MNNDTNDAFYQIKFIRRQKKVEQNEAAKQDKLQLILEYYTQYKISKESSISVQKNLFLDVLITNETVHGVKRVNK